MIIHWQEAKWIGTVKVKSPALPPIHVEDGSFEEIHEQVRDAIALELKALSGDVVLLTKERDTKNSTIANTNVALSGDAVSTEASGTKGIGLKDLELLDVLSQFSVCDASNPIFVLCRSLAQCSYSFD